MDIATIIGLVASFTLVAWATGDPVLLLDIPLVDYRRRRYMGTNANELSAARCDQPASLHLVLGGATETGLRPR